MKLEIPGAEDMERLGSLCSAKPEAGTRVFLKGDLGAGKTTFARGFLRGLGYQGKVKSPTYTLVEPYDHLPVPVYHFDLYRLTEPLELEAIGGRDYFDGGGLCLVEWPEKAMAFLGQADLIVDIQHCENGRDLHLQAGTAIGKKILADLKPRILKTFPGGLNA